MRMILLLSKMNWGYETVSDEDNRSFLKIQETAVNLIGESMEAVLGSQYHMLDKYHMIIPSVCGGQRRGTILLARYGSRF